MAETEVNAPLSDEVNEFDKPFVLSSDGTTTFGEVTEDSGLTAAPIKLSLGENKTDDNGDNHGYGLLHIEAGHGDQIRAAGFSSVEEFVETVAKNYDTIREGNAVSNNQTYLLEVSDEHNNTLFIQLSKDESYWNVNSAGIFRKKYSRRMREVASLPTIGNSSSTETVEVNRGHSNGATATSENSSLTSEGKGGEKSATDKGKGGKSFDFSEIEALQDAPRSVMSAIEDYAVSAYNAAHLSVPSFQFGVPESEQVNMTYDKFLSEFKEKAGVLSKGCEEYLPAVYDYITSVLENKNELTRSSEPNSEQAAVAAGGGTDDAANGNLETEKTPLINPKNNSALDNTTDTDKTLAGNGNDTATPESTVISSGKGSEVSENEQGISEKEASEQDEELRDALVEFMQGSGLDVISGEEGQRVVDEVNARTRLSRGQKRLLDTAPLIQKEGSMADVSSSHGAKILKNLKELATKLEIFSSWRKNILSDIAEA